MRIIENISARNYLLSHPGRTSYVHWYQQLEENYAVRLFCRTKSHVPYSRLKDGLDTAFFAYSPHPHFFYNLAGRERR